MISRQQALDFLNNKISNKNIIKHMIAAEALMRALARKLNGNEDEWGMAGLLHDGDYIDSVPMNQQGIQISQWLREAGYEVPDNVAHAMAAHNADNTGVQPESLLDWALYIGDSLTGLIVASALVLPTKKLADLTADSVLKHFKEKSFAKGTRRDQIALCEEKLGLPLDEFVKISLTAMQGVADELSL